MLYRGHVQNGMVVFDESVSLPEGTPVTVGVSSAPRKEPAEEEVPTLYERLEGFVGQAHGLPPDASVNVDHYLYGVPKQQ
jgi:hypothetical protein